MGFRHLETFNKAMLAKHIWCIINEPGSLVARVLKARYYRHQDIMDASLESNPSYFWRSLLWSRPLLAKGLCWKVGDGTTIATFGEHWIPGSVGRLVPPSNSDNFSTVSTLLEEGSWNDVLVNNIFSPHIAKEIVAIPLSRTQKEDFRFWAFDLKGKYSVRDGYQAEIGLYESHPSCSEHRSKGWWRFIWFLNIPPKVRNFWWRALQNIILTEQNLLAHHVSVIGSCPLCHYAYDSTDHALFTCSAIKTCWKGTQFWPLLKISSKLDALDTTIWMKERLSKNNFEGFVMRTWEIWNERLRLIHHRDGRPIKFSVDLCEDLLHDFQLSRLALQLAPDRNIEYSPDTWSAPPEGSLRVDVDAAYNEINNHFAIGGLIRNHEGQPLLAFGRKLEKPPSVLYAELLAIEYC